jgi:hypothetical protein
MHGSCSLVDLRFARTISNVKTRPREIYSHLFQDDRDRKKGSELEKSQVECL